MLGFVVLNYDVFGRAFVVSLEPHEACHGVCQVLVSWPKVGLGRADFEQQLVSTAAGPSPPFPTRENSCGHSG
jgi:hypothetical protein